VKDNTSAPLSFSSPLYIKVYATKNISTTDAVLSFTMLLFDFFVEIGIKPFERKFVFNFIFVK
jgi:hypothetical protein